MGDDVLMSAYRQTSFFADTPRGRFCLRVGSRHADLDAWLVADGVRCWAYVTACNPGSVPLSDTDNRRRQEDLERVVVDMGHRFCRGEGIGDDRRWPPEQSLLMLGIARAETIALGRRFGQHAIVYGEVGGEAQLLRCSADGPERRS